MVAPRWIHPSLPGSPLDFLVIQVVFNRLGRFIIVLWVFSLLRRKFFAIQLAATEAQDGSFFQFRLVHLMALTFVARWVKKLERTNCSLEIRISSKAPVRNSAELKLMPGRGLPDSACLTDENQCPRVPVMCLIESILGHDRSRNVAIVVIQHPAESLTTLNFANKLANFGVRIDERVFQALVISLGVIEPNNPMPIA